MHVVVSNRCFPTKAIARQLKIREEERLNIVADYLYFSGWSNIEIVDLRENNGDEEHQDNAGLAGPGLVRVILCGPLGA